MNIVLYGVPQTAARRIAAKYGLKRIAAVEQIDGSGSLLTLSPMKDPQRLLALYNALTLREDLLDAVIVCGLSSCQTACTMQYCTPPGKLYTLSNDAGEEALEEEIIRIVDTLSGALCAHEGI